MKGKQILTIDNVLNISLDCGKTVDFHQHKMNFLNKSILYTFQESVNLKRGPYNMIMKEISSSDKLIINSLFSRLDKTMSIKDNVFINSKEVPENTYDEGYANKDRWMLTIEIQGIKKLNNESAPIWKIKTVKKLE